MVRKMQSNAGEIRKQIIKKSGGRYYEVYKKDARKEMLFITYK